MPKCFAYGRHSTNKQGQTREVQEYECKRYYDTHLASKGIEYAGFFYDPAESGGTRFSEREAGRFVFFSLARGDYLICTAMDRLFRDRADAFSTLDQLDRKGVKRVILDLPDLTGLDMDVEIMEMVEGSMVVYAHTYRRMLGRKMRKDNAVKREAGIPYSRGCPPGWKQIGDRKDRQYRVDNRERSMIDFMHTLMEDGMSAGQIALWCQRQTQFNLGSKRSFTTEKRVRWALRARLCGYPLITNVEDFQRQWRSGELTVDRSLLGEGTLSLV